MRTLGTEIGSSKNTDSGMRPEQKRKLGFWLGLVCFIAAVYIGITSFRLYESKKDADDSWEKTLHQADEMSPEQAAAAENALQVLCGTYVENIDEIDIRQSHFSVTFQLWFSWDDGQNVPASMFNEFMIYNGKITGKEILQEQHENGRHYQLLRVDATVKNVFKTDRFPLSSYQLKFYVMPKRQIDEIAFVPDEAGSAVNPSLIITGFRLMRSGIARFIWKDANTARYMKHENEAAMSYSEVLTAIELNRSSWGLYLKCIIALLGTSIWVLLTLFVCTYHHVNTLNMLPPILFGTVTNIMVGANLVPDAMETGLLEYINIWGIYTVIIGAIIIVQINGIRTAQKDFAFARKFGVALFYVVLITTLAGHIILPLSAYRF